MPKVSIVIPTYNQAALLKEALACVRDQTEAAWEAIIVDNHSEDETLATIKAFNEPRFRTVQIHNNGVIAASRNVGISEARSDWIAFLDSDDLWEPEKLEICLAHTENAELISHRETTLRDGKKIRVSPTYQVDRADYRRLLLEGNCLSPTAVMVRRAELEKVGGFSEDPALATCEDYDLWLRLARSGVRTRFIDAVLSSYRLHDANTSGAVLRHMDAGLKTIEQHYAGLAPKRWFDPILYRRQRAMTVYSAGRSFQRAGRRREAWRYLMQSLCLFPLNPRAAVSVLALALPDGGNEAQEPGRRGWPIVLGYIWVFGIFLMYIRQFEDKFDHIIKAFIGAG